MVTSVSGDQCGGSFGGFPADTFQKVRIGVSGNRNRAVAESFRDEREVNPGGEHQRRRAVAKIVQPHPPEPGPLGEVGECLGDRIERQRVAVLPSEHEIVIGVRVAPLGAFDVLGEPVGEQHAGGAAVQLDHPRFTARCLRRPERVPRVDFPAAGTRRRARRDLDELLTNYEHTTREVHIGPSQPAGLTPAQPGGRD